MRLKLKDGMLAVGLYLTLAGVSYGQDATKYDVAACLTLNSIVGDLDVVIDRENDYLDSRSGQNMSAYDYDKRAAKNNARIVIRNDLARDYQNMCAELTFSPVLIYGACTVPGSVDKYVYNSDECKHYRSLQ